MAGYGTALQEQERGTRAPQASSYFTVQHRSQLIQPQAIKSNTTFILTASFYLPSGKKILAKLMEDGENQMIKSNLGQVKCLLDFVNSGILEVNSKGKMPVLPWPCSLLHLIKLSRHSRTTISNNVSHNSFTLRRNFKEKLWVYKGVRSHHQGVTSAVGEAGQAPRASTDLENIWKQESCPTRACCSNPQ